MGSEGKKEQAESDVDMPPPVQETKKGGKGKTKMQRSSSREGMIARRSSRLVVKELEEQKKKEEEERRKKEREEKSKKEKAQKKSRKRKRGPATQTETQEEGEEDSEEPSSYTWETFCSSIDDWEAFEKGLCESDHPIDQDLYEELSEELFPKVLEDLRAREKANEKKMSLDAQPRKRSARIFKKEIARAAEEATLEEALTATIKVRRSQCPVWVFF